MKNTSLLLLALFSVVALITLTSMTMDKKTNTGAYLEITLDVKEEDRMKAGAVYVKYKQPFLKRIDGATSKDLLLRTDDVQVLHGFMTVEEANAYLTSELFSKDIVEELKPYLQSTPEVRVYTVFN